MSLTERLRKIRLAAFDVDGVFTDGRFYLSNDLVESKAFCTLDGYGVRRLLEAGIAVAIISGRPSPAVAERMRELGVRHVYLGCKDKVAAFEELRKELSISADECLYAGDDLPDLPLLQRVGIPVAVANAHPDIISACDVTTKWRGGFGAVREICDQLINARQSAT
ncbi:MAG: HAD hydrolase family protein [Woeseia sp.]|nr:HAD hydrolase family protein [Woeseia sp.]NNE61267.1 HAD hydrolase family protein [Woeseia sp.]